jgi:hypothetical protein
MLPADRSLRKLISAGGYGDYDTIESGEVKNV